LPAGSDGCLVEVEGPAGVLERLAVAAVLLEDTGGGEVTGRLACRIIGTPVEVQGLPQVSLSVIEQAQLYKRIAEVVVGECLSGPIAEAPCGVQSDLVRAGPVIPVPAEGEEPPQS
jgi:hypothetical protein